MKPFVKYCHLIMVAGMLCWLMPSCVYKAGRIESGKLLIEVNDLMQTRVNSTDSLVQPLMIGFQASEFLISGSDTLINFLMGSASVNEIKDNSRPGDEWIYRGTYEEKNVKIAKILSVKTYDAFPGWAFFNVTYINEGNTTVIVNKWVNNAYSVESREDTPDFWSFQGSSSGERRNWVLPVKKGFFQQNYMGMNDPDYGGGIPVADLWRRDVGIAIGHTAPVPKLVSLPVDMKIDPSAADICIEYSFREPYNLRPGDTLKTLETFVSVHRGDYFSTLREYTRYMAAKGFHLPDPEPLAFEPMWCAWGYMRKFTVDEILGTLPKVKELGFEWVTVDDGYQQAEGDWDANPSKFPRGDADMKKLVDAIHSYGFKAQIWWSPLAMDSSSRLMAEHPDLLLKNEDGSPQVISWWDAWYMSPAYPGTIRHTEEMVQKFIGDWGYDGLKLDGQHLNACPPDYNPVHHLSNPEEAPESVPGFFRVIFETARKIKPNALIQLCPCGDAMSFYNIPYTNQFVASDPEGSTQIRSKGKTYKAIAPGTAYFGDHVELSDKGSDFASTIGVGGVPGTKFTWPHDNPYTKEKNLLTPEREKTWKKWISIYKEHMLSKGDYLGDLYDIGYDVPETHVIRKADTLFYSFFADNWKGTIMLKGLGNGVYRVVDYINNKNLGTVEKLKPGLNASFRDNLLIMVYPVKR
jgi:alpha-galactosidase